ncbi:hypothetical protein GCM10011430_23330 [Oxalicibacterium solurbis]|uniref:Uncharacterized protein n=1 Tax=Oxalicibacterium solurbis TaxID=69280 RepID=A0A8J3F6J4_9BURK|nr:hypothetical protein GCM10011430_23330 [Oxalicibacterium solurbis]
MGIGAWIAGEAFYTGYWNAAGVRPIVSMSLQQTAFAGFAAAYYNWAWLPVVLGIFSLYIAVLSFGFKNKSPLKILWIIKSKKWWDENVEIDKTLSKLFKSLLVAAILFFILILTPLTLWVIKAMEDGKNVFYKQACAVKAAKTLPSKIMLDDGTAIGGRILARSEHLIVFLTDTSIDVIAIDGEKSRLLDSTHVSLTKCL